MKWCVFLTNFEKLIKKMDLFENKDWNLAVIPLLAKYKGRKHPLDYQNLYQLLVMVVLSAQDSDANINKIAPILFDKFPNIEILSKSSVRELIPYVNKIKHFEKKSDWLIEISQILKTNDNIPLNMKSLTLLKGIGRKSANVILRESNTNPEGIIVDLHVVRVAPRIGLTNATDANKIEIQLMNIFDKKIWSEVGMAISFLGREICRPTNPRCYECPIHMNCNYYNNL